MTWIILYDNPWLVAVLILGLLAWLAYRWIQKRKKAP